MIHIKINGLAVVLPVLAVCACTGKTDIEDACRDVRARIERLGSFSSESDGRENGRDFRCEVEAISEGIRSATTSSCVRVSLFRHFKDAFWGLNVSELSDEKKIELEYDYWRAPVAIGIGLLGNGAEEDEAFAVIIDGFKKYREMCFSLSKEDGLKDCQESARRNRRAAARGLRQAWNNEVAIFERVWIGCIFGTTGEGTGKRFLDRWHSEFGCHLKSHPEYKALNPGK